MNTVLIGTEAVDLLSRITGQKLSQRDITPPIVFLATLVTVLSGVIYVDGVVTNEEKQRLHNTLNKFSLVNSSLGQLTQLMLKGVAKEQFYKKLGELTPLIALLSPSQRLLLVGFGYEMSAADGDIDTREQKYLQIVANRLEIASKHLAVIEASFSHQGDFEQEALVEVHSLLDSARFHDLDAVFIKAASDLVAVLPTTVETISTQKQNFSTYEQLAEFQKHRQQIDSLCFEIYKIVKDCADSDFLPSTLVEEIETISKKLQSQRFRVAVIGEFSQGKSTLLNALLGQEIQPVRAVPCSGTITVLRYGKQKRIICRYKDEREEEISLEEYKEKASISKQAALDGLNEELGSSEIDEIIFESPDLTLCQNGVEILDSPGLNEHPQRTAITQKLLKETDAAIFLTNAMRLLPEKEKELLQDVKNQLTDGQENEPAENLFILVNFMDLLDDEKDKIDIKQRLDSFINGKNQLVKGEGRIHYISAKAAFKSILIMREDEYLQAFQKFINHLEQFLIFERGNIKINDAIRCIYKSIESCVNGLDRAVDILDGKVKISETERQKIIEKIGEASGRDVKIVLLGNQMIEQTIAQAEESWNKWREELANLLIQKSKYWNSPHSPVLSQKDLIKDYINCFTRDLINELDKWGDRELGDSILKSNIKLLTTNIEIELEAVQAPFQDTEQQVQTNLYERLNFSVYGIGDDFAGAGGFLGGLGIGGALAAGLLAFTPLGLVAIVAASLTAVVAGSFGLGMLDFDGLREQIKIKVLELGFKKFEESQDKIFANLHEVVKLAIAKKVQLASQVIEQVISQYENLLEQQDKVQHETIEQRNTEKICIARKCKELEQLQLELNKILG